MQHNRRFKLDIARRDMDCYDCRKSFEVGSQFAWDNTRNCKICPKCLEKLNEMVGASDGSGSDSPKQKVYWDTNMLPTRPWEVGNYDLNSWPIELQKEYVELARSPEQYLIGLKQAQARLRRG